MIKKFITGFVSGSLLLATVLPAAAVTVEVTDNGAKSDNYVSVHESCNQTVEQKNNTSVGVSISLSGNSGKNKASGNTGGSTTIKTGDVTNTAVVAVSGGNNEADVVDCCCSESEDSVTVSGNGYKTDNTVRLSSRKSKSEKQKTKTLVEVEVELKGNSGKNKAKHNTGGDVEEDTGNVENTTEVVVEGGHNTL